VQTVAGRKAGIARRLSTICVAVMLRILTPSLVDLVGRTDDSKGSAGSLPELHGILGMRL
jgi:hypothetical protein